MSIIDYYASQENLIKESIQAAFPDTCTEEWLAQITGRNAVSWDVQTITNSFLKPINTYINNKPNYYYALGCILLLEASGINPKKYLPLLALTEFLEANFLLLADIELSDHESEDQYEHLGLDIDNAIKANAGVAMLTLPFYPMITNLCEISPEAKFRLYNDATTFLARFLFANGVNVIRKRNNIIPGQDSYEQNAAYTNAPKLLLNLDFWLTLTRQSNHEFIFQECTTLANHFAYSWQLESDYSTLINWLLKNSQENNHRFKDATNYINIYYSSHMSEVKVVNEYMSNLTIRNIVADGTFKKHISEIITKNNIQADKIINSLPLSDKWRELFRSYFALIQNTNKHTS